MKNTMISLRMPPDLIKAARLKARQQDRPLSQIVRELLRAWLAEHTHPVPTLK